MRLLASLLAVAAVTASGSASTHLWSSSTLTSQVHGSLAGLHVRQAAAPCAAADTPAANGIAVDTQGDVYVARGDSSAMAMVIQKWSPTGSLLATWKIAGVASVHPYPYRIAVYGIAVTRQGNMYVVDPAAGRVLQLSPGGTLLSQWGRPGHARGQLDQPVGVALDGHGHVYVADRGNNRVQEFSSGGRLIAVWGKRHAKSAPGLFVAPTSIAIDGRGRVHLADDGNRLLTLSPRGKVLDVSDFTKGSEVGDFRHPDGIAVDGQGNVYVGDKLNCRIQKLAPDGSVQVWQLAPIAGAPASPTGLAMDPQGNVYAVEVGAAIRIQLFSPTGALLREWQVP